MKCSAVTNSERNDGLAMGDSYTFTPLGNESIILGEDSDTVRIVEAVNALVKENKKLKDTVKLLVSYCFNTYKLCKLETEMLDAQQARIELWEHQFNIIEDIMEANKDDSEGD